MLSLRSRIATFAFPLVLVAALVGCESPPPSGPTEPVGQRIEEFLNDVAEKGQLDSGIVWLEGALDEYAVDHPEVAAELKQDYQELSGMKDAASIRRKATEMAAKVES